MPVPSHSGHMPPVIEKVRFSLVPFLAPVWMVTAPAPDTEGMLNAYACGEPTCGVPNRENRTRSRALASVAVPTVERMLAPMRSWSTRIAVVRPSRWSTSGRAREGMKPCRKAL